MQGSPVSLLYNLLSSLEDVFFYYFLFLNHTDVPIKHFDVFLVPFFRIVL